MKNSGEIVLEEMDTKDAEELPVTEDGNSEDVNKDDFKVIGSLKRSKLRKVNPILPKWMSNSTKFDGDIETNSSDLLQLESSIDHKLLETLTKNNVEKLFPVQKAVIPCLIDSFQKLKYCQPRDICVLSPTGSGKTLAFVIPIVNYLLKRVVTQVRALVILPVSDLASQVH